MSKKKVLILGGALLQSYVIKRAKELDYEVHVLDMNPNSIGFKYADKYDVINIVDQEACLKYAKENNIDGVLTAATDYGVLSTSYIAENLKLNGLKYEVAKLIKNKYEVRKKLFDNRADDINQFFEVSNIEDIKKITSEIIYPVMVKPCDGSGSKAASKVEKEEDLERAIKEAMNASLSHKVLIETFIDGKEYGAESFVYNREVHVLGIMEKNMTKPPYYAELGHTLPSNLPSNIEEKVINTVKKSIEALGVNYGSVNMDLLITKDGKVCIIDVGARMGGNLIGSHIIPLATGIDYMGNMIKASVGDKIDFEVKKNECVSTRILALTPGIVKKLPDFKKYYDDDIKHIVCNLKEGDMIREYHTNLDGCGYIVSCGNDREYLKDKVRKIKEEIDINIIKQ